MSDEAVRDSAALIRELVGEALDWAVVLGSGLGGLADGLGDAQVVDYRSLPGFPPAGVGGHAGRLHLGRLGESRVALLQGRSHFYESRDPAAMAVPVRALAEAGCPRLLLTNAAGSLRPGMGPGALMLIEDHLGLNLPSPLVGVADDSRFVDMRDAYDPALRNALLAAADVAGVALHRGVYAFHVGPQFETPAEIRALAVLGADAVGMSTVPECILARHAGMRVAAVSNITNMAAGMSDEALSHAHTQAQAGAGARDLLSILQALWGAPSA